MLYHLATGSYPVRGRTLQEIRRAHRDGVSTPLPDERDDLPEPLTQAIERALAPDPARRFENTGVMQAALATVLQESGAADDRAAAKSGNPAPISPPSSAGTIGPGRTRGLVVAGIGVALVCVGLAVAVSFKNRAGMLHDLGTSGSDRQVAAGRREWSERTPAGFERAREAFGRAIVADPKNPLAYSGLADTYSLLESFGLMEHAAALEKARSAADQAVTFGPALAEPHASLSFVLWEEGDHPGAMKEADRAIALNPRYATAHHWHALYLQDLGRFQDAIDEARLASAIDPESPVIAADVALMLRNAGRLDESQELLDALLVRHPSFPGVHVELAEAYRRKKQYALALERMRTAVQLGDDRPPLLARLAWLEARNGNRNAAIELARRLRADEDRGRPVPNHIWVEALVAAGDLEGAADYVEKAIAERSDWTSRTTTDELFEGLRRHSRWPELQEKIASLGRTLPAARVVPPVRHSESGHQRP